jgi:hypothetical protein
MSLEDNSELLSPTKEGTSAEDRDTSVRALAQEAVPLHDPATGELERERAERVRVVVGRGPRLLPRLPRRATSVVGLALLAALGLVAIALAATGGGGQGIARHTPRRPGPARRVSALRPTASSTGAPTRAQRHRPRRRATTEADGTVARRRPRHARRAHARDRAPARDGGHRQSAKARRRSAPAAKAASGGASTVAAAPPTVPTPEAESAAAESAPDPDPEPEPEPEAAPEPEPGPEPEPEPAAEAPPPAPEPTSPPPRSPVEGEFSFER